MLCWICPDCGRDCSPAVRECPACAQQQSGVTDGVLSMVQKLREAPSVPLLAAAPEQYLLFGLTNGHSSVMTETVAPAEEDPAVPAGETIDSLVRPLVESAKTAAPDQAVPNQAVPTKVAPAIEPPRLTVVEPPAATASPLPEPAAFAAPVVQVAKLAAPTPPQAKLAPPVESLAVIPAQPPAASSPLVATPTPLAPVAKFAKLAAPVASLAKTSRPLKAVNLAAAQTAATIAVPLAKPTPFRAPGIQIVKLKARVAVTAKTAPSVDAPKLPVAEPRATTPPPAVGSAPFAPPVIQLPKLVPAAEPIAAAEPAILSEALALQAELLLDAIQVQIEAYESEIRAIVAAFQTQLKVSLLSAPREIVAAPAPPDEQWRKTPRPAIPSSKLADPKCASLAAPPQKLPLAGPCLPPELKNFIEEPPTAPPRAKRGIGLPAWIISLVIATAVFLGAGNLIQYLSANRDAKAIAAAAPSAQAVASAPAAPAFEPHPFARFVEVTGLRVVADLNHRSQVQYIVVNHSSALLSGMLIRVAVRSSSDPAGSAPLFTVSTVVPSLGPHQSKEIRTDLDSELRSSAIPDWEYLRTDVQVGTQN